LSPWMAAAGVRVLAGERDERDAADVRVGAYREDLAGRRRRGKWFAPAPPSLSGGRETAERNRLGHVARAIRTTRELHHVGGSAETDAVPGRARASYLVAGAATRFAPRERALTAYGSAAPTADWAAPDRPCIFGRRGLRWCRGLRHWCGLRWCGGLRRCRGARFGDCYLRDANGRCVHLPPAVTHAPSEELRSRPACCDEQDCGDAAPRKSRVDEIVASQFGNPQRANAWATVEEPGPPTVY
jgi:hypothetical protein